MELAVGRFAVICWAVTGLQLAVDGLQLRVRQEPNAQSSRKAH